MKRMKKISRSAISLVLAFSILFSGTSIAPITVSTARAIEAGTILEHGFGLLGTVAGAIGPALFGKILNSTGNSELADYLGLNKANEVTLEELKESIDDIQDQLGTISEQVTTLSNELASEADRLESWTTLTTFQQSYGGLSSNNDYLQTMLQLDNGDYSESSYQKQLGQLMETIYRDDAFRQDVIAMGDAIMGEGSSLVSPTRAYYDHRKQVDGTTRDQLKADYLAFSTSVYKDYVISLLLCNASMTYLAEQEGGNVLYEIQMNNMAQQAQRVKAFLYNEREALFPADRLDGVSGGAVPSTAQSANDYVITYENGQPVRTQTKQGASANDLLLSEDYLMLNVGEATAVKVFKSGQQFGDWTTSDPSVAVVDELGGVFATGAGTAILTVNYGGYTKRVQVDVLDVDSNGLPITTTTGEVKTVTANASFDLDKLLDEAGIEEADAADFTWTSTDTNSVSVSGTTIKGVAKSGGYSMVTGMRHMRYDTDGGSFYTVEKVIFPFKAEYTDTSEVYDYDDMIYENCFEKSGRITLATDLTAASPYGQICQKTKLRFDLVSNDGLIVDGKGHCMDLMGARLMQEMNAQSSVSNISLYSSCNMDDAAVVNELPATAVIKDVDINVNIVGNRQYLGGAVNESNGRIDGVTFYGSITNSYTSDAKDITSSVNGSATLPQEGIGALYGDNDQEHAIMYQTGTGGIVGRQDVNAKMNDGKWTRTDTTTGIYNCYSSGDITAGTNTGGIAGLVVGAWSIVENNGNTAFDPVDLRNVSEEDPANAAYVPVYASVSDSDVRASAKDGIAGGLIGFSVFADIKGGSVTGSVTGGSDASGRASGVSGIYLPTIWRSIPNLDLQIYFAQGSGCLIDGVLVGASISSGNGRVSPYYYDDMSVNFPEHTGNPFSGTYQEFIDNEFQKHDLYQSKDEIDEVNSNVSNTIDAVLRTNSNAGINNGWPVFSTTHTGVTGSFDMENVYEYGDGLTPVTSDNVIRIEYAAQGSTQFSEAVPTDVGNYTARATFTDGTMVNDTFQITPRIVTLVDPAETTLEFEDRELTVKSPYISNAVLGDDVAVTVEVGSNKGSEVGEYTVKVTGLTGVDAANYKLPESGYTMPWSITISDQKPAKIVLTLNEQLCDSYTLYYNDEARNTLDLRSITTMVTDEDGYEYRGDDTVTWSYKGDGAALIDGVLKASKQGKGTLIATIGDVSAEIAITIAEQSTINRISQAEGAELVRIDTAYDLTTIPLRATDLGGHPYTLSKDELNAISWEVWQEQSKGITATVDGTTLKVTALEGREGILVLKGVLNDVSWNAELVVRQQSVPTELEVTTLQSDSVISLTPNTTREIANYLSCICLDQYGDEMDAEITWKSDNTDVLTISDNEELVASKIEGTANVTASIGALASAPVTIQVAGAPRLTSIKITGAPQALGWNEMLDLRTLIVSKYDQRGNEMTGEASKIYWSLENDENTDAEVLNDLVNTGSKNGTFKLTASAGSISDSVEIVVGPQVTGLSLSQKQFASSGGDVIVTLSGERLSEGIVVGLFDSTGENISTAISAMNEEICSAVLTVPKNETEEVSSYVVKISYDGSSYLESPTETLSVAAAGTDIVLRGIELDKDLLHSEGGDVLVTLTGDNLRSGLDVALCDDDHVVTMTKTTMAENSCTATLKVPVNESTGNIDYTVNVSLDGETYLNEPIASLTVSGKSGGGNTGGGGGGIVLPPLDDEYEIAVDQPENGKIEGIGDKAEAGDEVTITVTPDEGYVVKKVVITDEDGNVLQVTDNGDGTFTFIMPEGAIKIEAEFAEEGEEETPVIDLPFNDVEESAWYADAVQFVFEQGLMTGVSKTNFGPDLTTTRGMIVTMLYRLQGEPEVGEGCFSDVNAAAYYADAVTWAAENDIVSGYGNMIFGPNDAITREQLAAILYRYCEAMGYEISARSDFSAYSDADSISNWATDVMSWAHAMGLINGVSKTELAPQATATRAQVAAILERFLTIDWEA